MLPQRCFSLKKIIKYAKGIEPTTAPTQSNFADHQQPVISMPALFGGIREMTPPLVRKLISASIFIRIDYRRRRRSSTEIEATKENKLILRETIFFHFPAIAADPIDVHKIH